MSKAGEEPVRVRTVELNAEILAGEGGKSDAAHLGEALAQGDLRKIRGSWI
jgi:hypothetical protein